MQPEAKASFQTAIEVCKALGAEIVDIDLDILKYSIAVYYILSTAEASTNLARFDGMRYGVRSPRAKTLEEVYDFSKQEGFGPEVKQRILLGTYVLSSGYQDAYYKKAQKVRTLMIQQVQRSLCKSAISIAMPTSPFTSISPSAPFKDPLQMYLARHLHDLRQPGRSFPPSASPAASAQDNKPLGLQLLAPSNARSPRAQPAHAFEKATDFSPQILPYLMPSEG